MSHFAGDISKHQNKWSDLWDKGDFLPWDRGMPNPALVDILTHQRDLLGTCFVQDDSGKRRRKKALVPGCGKGYDVLLLASFGYDAFGLEVSQTAVKRCYEEQKSNGHEYPVRDDSTGAGAVKFMHGDFFGTGWMSSMEGDAKFDLIYDYTVGKLFFNRLGSWTICFRRHFRDPATDGQSIVPLSSPTKLPS